MLKVLTIATEMKPTLEALVQSCHGKLDLEVTMHLGKWDWGIWLDWQMDRCRAHLDDHLVFVDAYDTLFVGDPGELENIVKKVHLIHSTCKNCWPIKSREKLYPYVPGPWKYLNSCGPAGRGRAILEGLEYGMAHFPYPHPELEWDVDQRFWTDVYLSGYGQLDYACQIWQDLHLASDTDLGIKDDRIKNLVFDTWPQFLHASAHTWHRIPKELLNGD
jgi:hypothetical protein